MRTSVAALLLSVFTCTLITPSSAQNSFPSKPIRIVVPFPAGGATDAMLRLLQDPVSKSLGQPLIIDNRPGAAGMVGARHVAEATADGHTVLVVNTGVISITPFVQKASDLAPLQRFSPVVGLSSAPSVLLVHPALPANNVQQFLDYARANPEKIEYGVVGKGAYGDVSTSLFQQRANIRMLPISYQGNAQTNTALLSGEIKAQLTILSGPMNDFIRSGRVKALGVATLGPSALVPGIPPIANDIPGFEAVVYTGLVAPAGTSADVIDKLSQAFIKALENPVVSKQLNAMGMEAAPLAAKHYRQRIQQERSGSGFLNK